MAVRYTGDDSIVFNAVDFGTAPDIGVAFSLEIDFSKIANPSPREMVALSIWMDTNDNTVIDNGEDYTSVTPNRTCPVFKDAGI